MALYKGSLRVCPIVPKWRGFWAVTVKGFPGTVVDCGTQKTIGESGFVIFKFAEAGTYTFVAEYGGDVKTKSITLIEGSYFVDLSMYILANYTQLEYIESTGTQYIDLGILSDGSVEVKFSPTRITGTASGTDYDGILGINGNPQLGWYKTGWTTGSAGSVTPYPPEIGKIYTYKWTSIDGKTYIDDHPTGLSRDGILTLKLFHCANDPKPSKCYDYKQYNQDNVLQVNLIPVCRVSDEVVGMFDLVSGQFFTNAGTGEFIAGPEVE